MVQLKLVCIFVFICVKFTFGEHRYEHISSCNYLEDYSLKFTCNGVNEEHNIFGGSSLIYCGIYGSYSKSYIRKMNFRNCHFLEIEKDFFNEFNDLIREFNISDVELQKLERKTFQNARKLQKLIASNNKLTEIPAQLFANSPSISYLDFSNNTIDRIDPLAFENVNNLQILNLSKNHLTELPANFVNKTIQIDTLDLSTNKIQRIDQLAFENINILVTLNLSHNEIGDKLEKNWFLMAETLDLTWNNFTRLNEHIFDEVGNLKHLNLSYNSIGGMAIGTFAYLTHLETLSLNHNNISSIQMGTFSHQHKLISLDLSENKLKMLDFELFLPILHDLQSLYLNQNQLTDLYGFRNAIFPQLALLDIKNNQFNCSYLRSFIASVDWSHLHMPVDPKLTKVHETNIRGVNCKNTSSTESSQTNNHYHEKVTDNISGNACAQCIPQQSKPIEITSTSFQQLHDDNNFVKLLLICIFVIVLILLIALLGRDQLFNSVNRRTGNDRRNRFSEPIVTYRNDELLLN